MLVIRRKHGERVRIQFPDPSGPSQGKTMWMTVLESVSHRGGTDIRLGFEGDRDVIVSREELLYRDAAQQETE